VVKVKVEGVLKRVIIFLFLFVILSSNANALLHYFKNAKKAEEGRDYAKALSLYKRVLERHPYETKALLRAYDRMLNIYKLNRDTQQMKELLAYLKAHYPDDSFDLRDIEKLSIIYSKYGERDDALRLQWMIINEPALPFYNKVVLRTYARLLKYYKERSEIELISNLLSKLSDLSTFYFDDKDLYEYAILFLRYGQEDKAFGVLKKIIKLYPDTVSSRKSLFILAEKAQKARDYNTAIEYYSTYIERYPENTFFIQKAYQRIVDCYLAMGDKRLSEQLIKQVADWINGIADYRSQLNLAVDLKLKNMDKLANIVFDVGYQEAIKVIKENPGTYEALKAHLEIVRASHAVGRYGLMEGFAMAILKDFNDLKGDPALVQAANFIKSQAYLWLARLYRDRHKEDEAITILEEFLKSYPEHKDREYVFYELGRAYEDNGDSERAKEFYRMVEVERYGAWQNRGFQC
jgi:tetratricopeptide (TPR) repeat protein